MKTNRNRSRWILIAAVVVSAGTALVLRAEVNVRQVSCESCCGDEVCQCAVCGCNHCVAVPDTKTTKKYVYATKLVPYCLTKCPNPFKCRHDSCESCANCEDCVRYKRVLVKREVVTTKTGCKCIPTCEACQARNQSAPQSPAKGLPGAPVAQPAEPTPVPASPGPTPTESSRHEMHSSPRR
jgi:hypothetical protein